MLNTLISPWPAYSEEEIAAVAAVLRTNRVNYWTGEECRKFECEFAEWVAVDHAIALTNGTVALDLALHGLGIGSVNGGAADDEVVVTPRSFIASVSCVVNAGAVPVFADVERESGNISAETIARALTEKTRAIIVVHLAGWPADLDPIMQLAEARGIKVIEDCAQAHGARYKGRSVGSIGHVSAWSFCQDKIMTTGGEGGMVTTNDPVLWSRMWAFKDHGKSWDAVYEQKHPPGFRWVHESFGTNWRMTEMQAAIGRIQLRRMADWTSIRTAHAGRLTAALAPLAKPDGPVWLPDFITYAAAGSVHAHYKYHFFLQPDRLRPGWSRLGISEAIAAQGVPCSVGSCSEIYREKAFDATNWRPQTSLPVAHELGETSLMLLIHPTLEVGQVERAGAIVAEILSNAAL